MRNILESCVTDNDEIKSCSDNTGVSLTLSETVIQKDGYTTLIKKKNEMAIFSITVRGEKYKIYYANKNKTTSSRRSKKNNY